MEKNIRDIILIIIGFIVTVTLLIMVFSQIEDIFTHKLCTWSIIFKDKFILGSNLCYTDDKEVKGKTKEEVMPDIAEKMVECWKRMDEGRINIDKNWFVGGYKCFKCYRIKITELEEPISYRDFYEFLVKTPIKDGEEEKYYSFFKKNDEDNQIVLLGRDILRNSKDLDNVFIDPEKYEYYAISFKGYSDVSLAPSAAIAYFTGPKGWLILGVNMGIDLIREALSDNSIIVAEYNAIDKVCSGTLT